MNLVIAFGVGVIVGGGAGGRVHGRLHALSQQGF